MRIAPEGRKGIGTLALIAMASWFVSLPMCAAIAAFALLVAWFYRDPERNPPPDSALWVSPADGKVVEVERGFCRGLGEATKVGIFMSIFDVHVNRVPFSGRVISMKYVPGKKWFAFAPKASEENERLYLLIDTPLGVVQLVQIAGILARRIACRVKEGDRLERGEPFGMIKLGSKVDVYLPEGVRPLVGVGEKVVAGETPIGVIDDEQKAQETTQVHNF